MEATTDQRHKRLMKQTSAWDLTCRPPSPEAALGRPASRSGPIQAGYMLAHRHHQVQNPSGDCHYHYHHKQQQQQQPQSRIMSPDLAQYQLAATRAAGPFVAPHSTSSLIWDNLSPNKQLQALLATATLAATSSHNNNNSNNSNYSTDLVSPLEWLQVPRKLDLTQPPSMVNSFDGAAIADKLYPMTISAKSFNSSPPSYQRQHYRGRDPHQDHHHHLDHHHQQASSTSFSLSSSSPVSSSSSPRSSSTESINLSLSKKFVSQKGQVGATNASSALDPRRQTRINFPAALSTSSPSTSGNSSDADYNGTGDTSNTSNSAIDARVDRRARKKDQNRRAAYNYRRKKMEERDRMIEEEARLVHKHVRLAGKIALLERKILLILSTETAKVLDKDGHIICYSCPVCSNHTCKDIQTLRNHLKTQHLQQDILNGLSAAESQGCHTRSSHLDTTTTVGEIVGLDDGEEYDSCTDSDETNNRAYDDLYNDCDAKFVISASLSGDNDNNNIKNSHSF